MSAATPDPRRLAGALLERNSWTAAQLTAHQPRQLAALLRHAVTSSPYYRRVLGPDAVHAPLAQLPTLSKATLMTHFDEIVTDARLRRSRLEEHLAGPSAGRPLHGYLVLSTAGSTGHRGIFVYSAEEFVPAVAAMLRTMILFGVTPASRIAGIGAADPVHISRHLIAGVAAGRPISTPRTSAADPLPRLVEAFNAGQPEVIIGYPSLQALLAEEQLAGRLHIAPRLTVLLTRTQPLIRYEITDSVTLAAGPNPTGRPFRRLTAVEGRSDDILHLPTPAGGTVAVHPVHLRAPFIGFPQVVQYQVVHDELGLQVSIVLRPGAATDTAERIRHALTGRLRTAGAIPPPVTVNSVPGIERGTNHAAKFAVVQARHRTQG